ncbi:uncharacterized protein [Macrobrachium rosenbergii]|uniref:uncharacterized protein n=1 Tax=Macrobrachium rosenbergii TaxID=79674 RepID=UPI0034D43AF5
MKSEKKKKMVVALRVGTLKVRTMTGKRREMVELGCGYKLLHSGTNKKGRNGVGKILPRSLKHNIISLKTTSDRAMHVKLCLGGKIVNVLSAYAPQARCDEVEKVVFWEEMNRQLSEMAAEEFNYWWSHEQKDQRGYREGARWLGSWREK